MKLHYCIILLLPLAVLFTTCDKLVIDPVIRGSGDVPGDMLVKGHGYLTEEDPCRVLERNAYVKKYLRQQETLLACPAGQQAALTAVLALPHARRVASLDQHVLVSLPRSY